MSAAGRFFAAFGAAFLAFALLTLAYQLLGLVAAQVAAGAIMRGR